MSTEIKVTRYTNGRISSKTPYVNGKKHGVDSRWFKNGKKEIERMWKEDKRHGMYSGWYENGQKRWEEMWKEGKQHGVETSWYENGEREEEIYYIAGKVYARIGWDEEGNVTKAKFRTPAQPRTPTINPPAKLKNHNKKK